MTVIGDQRFGSYDDEPDLEAEDDARAAGLIAPSPGLHVVTNLSGEGIASEPRSETAKGSRHLAVAPSPGRILKEAAGGLGPAAA